MYGGWSKTFQSKALLESLCHIRNVRSGTVVNENHAFHEHSSALVLYCAVQFLNCLTINIFIDWFAAKSFSKIQRYNSVEELKEHVTSRKTTLAATVYEGGVQKIVPRYDKRLENCGIHVENRVRVVEFCAINFFEVY